MEILYRREFKLSALEYEQEPVEKVDEYLAFLEGENKRIERERKHGH